MKAHEKTDGVVPHIVKHMSIDKQILCLPSTNTATYIHIPRL